MATTTFLFEVRPANQADTQFLRRLYASTRGEMAMTGWGPAQLESFLEMQFTARERHYREQFPSREDLVILVDGQAAGRLCIDWTGGEVRLVDIALLPEHRSRGVGTALVTALLRQAASAQVPVVLHVSAGNPAANLYRRLGFVVDSSDGVYDEMRWRPLPVGAGVDL